MRIFFSKRTKFAQRRSKMLVLSILTIPFFFFLPTLLASAENNKNTPDHQDKKFISQSSHQFSRSEKKDDRGGELNWQNTWSLLGMNLPLADSNVGISFIITVSDPNKDLSKLILGTIPNENSYFLGNYSSVEKEVLDQLGSQSPYGSTNYFYNKSLARWLEKEEEELSCKSKKNFKLFALERYNGYFFPFIGRNNTITVGMMHIEIPNLTVIERILKSLEEVGALTTGDRQALIRNIQYVEAIADGVETLVKRSILVHENFLILLENAPYAREMANGLSLLYEGGILTAENRQYLTTQHGEYAQEMALGMLILNGDGMLIEKNIRTLIINAQNAEETAKELMVESRKKISSTEEQIGQSLSSIQQYNMDIGLLLKSHWYDDDEVNALLENYVGERLGRGRLDAINLGQRDGETLMANLADFESLLGTRIPTVILPVNLGRSNPGRTGYAGNHWAALFIHHPNATPSNSNSIPIITYINPLGHPIPAHLQHILQRQYPGADIVNPNIRFQFDGYNCGPWIVEILRRLVDTNGMELPPERFDINIAREEHWNILQRYVPHITRRLIEQLFRVPSVVQPSAIPAKYKAAIFENFGPINDVLKVKNREMPAVGEDDILVRMSMSSINPSDLLAIRGFGVLPRYMKLPLVAGYEGVGKIVARGSAVQCPLGTRVLPLRGEGTWQEYVLSKAEEAVLVPEEIGDEVACQLYVNPLTIWVLLTQQAQLSGGDIIIINAAGSSFGRLLVQFAREFGYRSIALTRNDNYTEVLLELGAERVINTTSEDFIAEVYSHTRGQGVDCAFDGISGESGKQLMRTLKSHGRMIIYGVLSGQPIELDSELMFEKDISIIPFWLKQWIESEPISYRRQIFEELINFIKTHHIVFPELSCYPLDDACIAASLAENAHGLCRIAIKHDES